MKLIYICLLITTVTSINLVQLFGLTNLLEDLAKLPRIKQQGIQVSPYLMDPSIHTFLKQYQTRTQFCDYKCTNFFNIPCFLLFGCNIHIRNFVLMFSVPIFMLAMTGLCCGKGIWTLSCWIHYLGIFTGIKFIILAIKKWKRKQKTGEDKQTKQSKIQNKQSDNQNHLQIEPPTAQRINNRGSSSSSGSQES